MNSLYIILTESCNMSCPFCYNYFTDPNFKKPNKVIDADYAAKIINTGFKIGKTFTPFEYVIFHGGEPLLYPKRIMEILDRIEDEKKFAIQTNLNYKNLSQEQIEVLCRLGSYGTSYSWDRFNGQDQALKNMVKNIQFLHSLGLKSTLIVTITEEQILMQNPYALRTFIENEMPTIDYVMFERPIYAIDDIDKDKEKYTRIYHDVDIYLYQLVDAFAGSSIDNNLFYPVARTIKTNSTLFQKDCSGFTLSIYPDKRIKFGCPSKESKKIEIDEEFFQHCMSCEYFKYCKLDCECFNHVCAFPKKYFTKVSNLYKEKEELKKRV